MKGGFKKGNGEFTVGYNKFQVFRRYFEEDVQEDNYFNRDEGLFVVDVS